MDALLHDIRYSLRRLAQSPGFTALAVAVLALYVRKLEGVWRATYAITAVLSLYFLIFVLIAQFFIKVPALNALAPTLSEPPFAMAQLANLALFVVLMIAAARAFHPRPAGLVA